MSTSRRTSGAAAAALIACVATVAHAGGWTKFTVTRPSDINPFPGVKEGERLYYIGQHTEEFLKDFGPADHEGIRTVEGCPKVYGYAAEGLVVYSEPTSAGEQVKGFCFFFDKLMVGAVYNGDENKKLRDGFNDRFRPAKVETEDGLGVTSTPREVLRTMGTPTSDSGNDSSGLRVIRYTQYSFYFYNDRLSCMSVKPR